MFGQRETVASTDEGLTIEAVRERRPEFPRLYRVQVTPEVYMEVTTKDYGYGGRYFHGELRQRSGSAVWFEPENPADKILDRDLLPHVERWCRRILQIDRETFQTKPSEFVDETGQRWRRA